MTRCHKFYFCFTLDTEPDDLWGNRPTLTLTAPRPGQNGRVSHILLGMHDYDSGLDPRTFHVTADFPLDGVPAGKDLAARFKPKSPGAHELKLSKPITELKRGKLTVSVKDRQGNVSRVERAFSVR